MSKNDIAKVAHEINRALCKAFGDNTQMSWDEAEQWQRDSALEGVRLHLADPNLLPSSSHDAWSKDKRNHGWKWGEVKDATAKTHPCLVPFYQLPQDQQAKDFLFAAVVRGLARHLDP